MNQPIRGGYITVLVIAFVVIAGIFFWMGKMNSAPAETVMVPNQVAKKVEIKQEKKLDEAASWKIYKDTNYNFSFKYPEGILAVPSKSNNLINFYAINLNKSGDISAEGYTLGDVSEAFLSVGKEKPIIDAGSEVILNSPSGKITASYTTGVAPFGYTFYAYEFQKNGEDYIFRMNNYDNKPAFATPEQFKMIVESIDFMSHDASGFNQGALKMAVYSAAYGDSSMQELGDGNGMWSRKIEITSVDVSQKAAYGKWWAKDAWGWIAYQKEDGAWVVSAVGDTNFDCSVMKVVVSQYDSFFANAGQKINYMYSKQQCKL